MGEQDNSGEEKVEDKTATDDQAEGAKGTDETRKTNDGGNSDDKGADEDDDNADGAGDGADDKGGGKDGSEKKSKDDKSETAEKKPTQDANDEPPKRKRNIDFILERKNSKIAKEKDKVNDVKDEDADEDGIAPEDAAVIDKRVHKILSPFIDKQVAEEDKAEAETFVAANPHFKPYLDKVLKWAKDPARQNIPIESIFYEVAGKDLLKIGAELGKKADDKAKDTQGGGGTNRGSDSGTKPVWDLSQDEFEKEQEKVRNKQAE